MTALPRPVKCVKNAGRDLSRKVVEMENKGLSEVAIKNNWSMDIFMDLEETIKRLLFYARQNGAIMIEATPEEHVANLLGLSIEDLQLLSNWPLPLEPPNWTHLHIGAGQYIECVNDELDCKIYLQ